MDSIFIFSDEFKSGTNEQKKNYFLSFSSNIVFFIFSILGLILTGLCVYGFFELNDTIKETKNMEFLIEILGSIFLIFFAIGSIALTIAAFVLFIILQKNDKKAFFLYYYDKNKYINKITSNQYIKILLIGALMFCNILDLISQLSSFSLIIMIIPIYIITMSVITIINVRKTNSQHIDPIE